MLTTPIVKKPLISEKSLLDAKIGIYTFIVDKRANKIEIGREIESLFKVHVTSIKTEVVKGKEKTVGRKRTKTRLPDRKKARIKVKEGQSIPLFEVGGK
ncbi:50S ribosomal protein L23 [Candidatus Gottesmanbacteria bacterium RIFCSPHIGHO2_02_FULL_39_14]|uniref:Large ribosomal subunit protein uL23 n=3 Tax=Candidatus Gottesmaniibacteriota TaxID=1752720 RepID=A0A1F5ZU24_9BACT|nr:MAG: 50S ribosomal protein L23 [Candidatus Gottesmanbacteria bacterium RIFCSPHIGHO2_02_FULL_39_14]OGG31263.1 MAG: 50S ribosomal protein L23 [Candidatus Gottesmanbacteria bacterium RIFCSPLOWO2_02_FULL_38_8]